MNNSQFRRLLDIPTAITQSNKNGAVATPGREGSLARSFGSRMRSSIPMTPRSVAVSGGADFARQLAERNASLNPAAMKKFRSTAAPKGTKLKPGYQDRTQLRTSAEEDDKASRVKALEEMVKLGQMDKATFESLRDKIVGGDIKDVHLVKGLDWKLLERVRNGEDVLSGGAELLSSRTNQKDPEEALAAKVDDELEEELEKIEGQDVQPLKKEEKPKKGKMAPPQAMAGKKRNRDDILRELKESRLAAAEREKQPSLGPKFTKVGQKKQSSRVERDERGREILITVDEEGKVKRKVKRAKIDDETSKSDHGLLMPDKDAKPLGMEVVPIAAPVPEEEDGGDIFDGVGNDYNPLDGIEEDDSDDSDESGDSMNTKVEANPSSHAPTTDSGSISREPVPPDGIKPSANTPHIPEQKTRRNYFGDPTLTEERTSESSKSNTLEDPTILAALQKASTINPVLSGTDAVGETDAAKVARRKKMLESHDRDADDMDLGFGGSRFDDQEDGEDSRIKLSVWGDEEGDGEGKGGGGKGGKRKRAPKKRKGDGNSAADVLKAIERRKAGAR